MLTLVTRMASSEHQWPGYVEEGYPEVFNTIPPQTSTQKHGQLTQEQLKQFFTDGFVVVDKFFEPHELEPCKEAINGLVEELAQKLYNAGKVKDLYRDYGLYQRLTKLEQDFPGANVILHKLGILPQAFCDVMANERLLNVMEQLLGSSEILGSPVWNLRTKTPNNEAGILPWHQDSAYLDIESYKIMVATAWIPLIDATVQNGCLQVVRGGQKKGRVAMHQCCHGGTWYVMVEPDVMESTLGVNMADDVITTPVPYGGMLLFNNLTPHMSLPNLSNDIRWSLDLRWVRADRPQGFFGLKEGIPLRSSTNPDLKPDWEAFNSVNRTEVQYGVFNMKEKEFDTTIIGPWMKMWEIVNMNKHTEAQMEQDKLDQPQPHPIVVG